MSKGKEPTPKQKAFADEFLKCGNQTEAAKRAGYSEKTARQAGAENMKKPVVLEYIQKRQKQIDDARIADVHRWWSDGASIIYKRTSRSRGSDGNRDMGVQIL